VPSGDADADLHVDETNTLAAIPKSVVVDRASTGRTTVRRIILGPEL